MREASCNRQVCLSGRDIIDRLKLTRIINASGTMTSLGASRVSPALAAMSLEILDHFVDIDELQARAGAAIARATGAEAGCVTSSAASGMAVAVAAAITGVDLSRIERLPGISERKREVAIQAGHLINYGAPVAQAIGLAGARVKRLDAMADGALSGGEAAALYVVSHHVEDRGLPLADFIRLCKARSVPVIVDMASEYDLRGAIAAGADVAIYSAHKFLGGLTAGIVAGRKDLIRAVYLQNNGIGRHMKVGKEGIVGVIAALDLWMRRDHERARRRELDIVALWLRSLGSIRGLAVTREPDATGNPIDRVRVTPAAESGLFAWELADRLWRRHPSVRVRDDLLREGHFSLDPCNLADGQERLVAEAIAAEVEAARLAKDGRRMSFEAFETQRRARLLQWPEGY
jgi:D-glucosaminate-6-phosphate ammonia-lyase